MLYEFVLFFSRYLVAFLNGFLTQEIKINMGLKQGDPLYDFPFLLVVEGLRGLFSKALDQEHLTSL